MNLYCLESMHAKPDRYSKVAPYLIVDGAESTQKPMKQEDPDRRAGVKDSGGTTWWIATKID